MTLTTTVNAVARGFMIIDEGVMPINTDENPFAKFEFYMIKSGDGKTFSITIKNVGKLVKSATPKEHENLGDIYILWASKSGVNAIKTATITTSAGVKTVVNVVIDATSETLRIPVSSSGTKYLLWDIVTIDLA